MKNIEQEILLKLQDLFIKYKFNRNLSYHCYNLRVNNGHIQLIQEILYNTIKDNEVQQKQTLSKVIKVVDKLKTCRSYSDFDDMIAGLLDEIKSN